MQITLHYMRYIINARTMEESLERDHLRASPSEYCDIRAYQTYNHTLRNSISLSLSLSFSFIIFREDRYDYGNRMAFVDHRSPDLRGRAIPVIVTIITIVFYAIVLDITRKEVGRRLVSMNRPSLRFSLGHFEEFLSIFIVEE